MPLVFCQNEAVDFGDHHERMVQPSMYDADPARILHLHALGVPLTTIVDVHLKYGKYLSLKN